MQAMRHYATAGVCILLGIFKADLNEEPWQAPEGDSRALGPYCSYVARSLHQLHPTVLIESDPSIAWPLIISPVSEAEVSPHWKPMSWVFKWSIPLRLNRLILRWPERPPRLYGLIRREGDPRSRAIRQSLLVA